MNSRPPPWFQITNVAEVASPGLLIYVARVEENVRRMIAMAGGVARLRPHVKTHKLAELIRLQQAHGITKFKCATIAEAELAGDCGAADVLLAYQPVGPNVERLIQLKQKFSRTKFSALVDDAGAIRALSAAFARAGLVLEIFLDLDCGQHRTGVVPAAEAIELYRLIVNSPGLRAAGLHTYDGHIHDSDPSARAAACDVSFAPVELLRGELQRAGLPVPMVVAGGTPTFPMHARRSNVECSPGTCVFWDAGYATKLPDLDFLPAALVLTRVISKPGTNRLCLDVGHKAIAAENPHPRVQFPELPDAKAISHSEEHLVIETERAAKFAVGDALYGIPWHVCPTVALHSEAVVIKDGRSGERWRIDARARRLTI